MGALALMRILIFSSCSASEGYLALEALVLFSVDDFAGIADLVSFYY